MPRYNVALILPKLTTHSPQFFDFKESRLVLHVPLLNKLLINHLKVSKKEWSKSHLHLPKVLLIHILAINVDLFAIFSALLRFKKETPYAFLRLGVVRIYLVEGI
jgi:hypothetical protein